MRKRGGRISSDEFLSFNGNSVVSEYLGEYLRVFSPTFNMERHLKEKVSKAKTSVNTVWKEFASKV